MTLLTVVVMTVAVAVISVICVAGVYSMARAENDAALVAYRQLMSDDLTARLTLADQLAGALSAEVATGTARPAQLQRVVSESAAANVEYFDLLMFVDSGGGVLAASPSDDATAALTGAEFFWERASSDRFFAWAKEPGSAPALWVVRRAPRSPRGIYVVARLRTGFLSRVVDDVSQSKPSVSALVVDSYGAVIRAGASNQGFSPAGIRYGAVQPGGRGTATVASSPAGTLVGHYATIGPAPGLEWRVVVLESERDALLRAWSALVPAGIATLLVALLAVGSVILYSTRLVSPLRELEHRAHEVASGAHVRALRVDREDELGRLAAAFNEMALRVDSLQDLAELLASSSSLDDLLDAVLNAVGRILGTGDAAILLAEEGGAALTLARGRGLALPSATFLVSPEAASPVAEACRTQSPVLFGGLADEGSAAVHALFGAQVPRAGVAVPLLVGVQVLGAIVVLAPTMRPFTEAQIGTLRAFSANAAVAVHNSRLFEDEHVSRMQAEGLQQVAELIVRPRDLGDALEHAASVAAGLLGKESWALAIEGRAELGLAPAEDPRADRRLMQAWRAAARGGSWDPATRSEPVDVPDVHEVAGLPPLLGPRAGSAIFIPLVQGRVVRGVLVLYSRDRRPGPMPRRMLVAGTIGRQLSLAVRNAYLFNQARSRATNLETVNRISQAVSSELQLNVTLNRVLDVVQKNFSADAVALMLHDSQNNVIATSMARGVTSRELLYFQVRPGEDIPGEVFTTHRVSAHGDLSMLSTPLARLAASQGLRSLVVVPLLARGKAIGVLAVYANGVEAFSSEDDELIATFATQAALAIDTAALYEKEHHVASVLQTSILPGQLPRVPGLETASFYLPVGAEAEIGGDYYDLFVIGDGRVLLAIADVCGKGVLAATKTSMVKYSVRGLVTAGAGPASALAQLNRLVGLSGDPSDIVTAWVGILDLTTGRLVYANGGHPPGLVWSAATGRLRRLGATGPLLGAVPGVGYEERAVGLKKGDSLLLYTDGVTEARRGTQFFGEARIREVLSAGGGVNQTVDTLLAAIQRFSSGPLRDDAASLLVRISEEGARAV